jgi:hypothetical protein
MKFSFLKKALAFSVIVSFISIPALQADEGMWLPFLLENMNQADMQAMGLKLTAADIYSVNHSSLKDAVVLFNGNCTGELISDKGLLVTNHHCGYGAIQKHSSVEHDYLKDGFWALKPEEELTNPGMSVTFIVSMEDISTQVLKQVQTGMTERVRDSIIHMNMMAYGKEIKRDSHYDYLIRSFYEGNQYFLIVTETFRDIRLVGAPPSSIGKFGSDADNWVWPRHTGDFSLFRIYANKNNEPADYAPDNIPYTPKYSFPISLKGEKEGDFTMVYGFPGRTNEYACSWAIDLLQNISNPAKVAIRDVRLKIMDEDMHVSDKVRIQYAAKQSGVANSWKKWGGEAYGLKHYNTIQRKQDYEKEFQKRVDANPAKFGAYSHVLKDLHRLYDSLSLFQLDVDYFNEISGGIEGIRYAAGFETLDKLCSASKPDTAAIHKQLKTLKAGIAGFFKDYNEPTDHKICAALLKFYLEKRPLALQPPVLQEMNEKFKGSLSMYTDMMYGKSIFVSEQKTKAFLDKFSPSDIRQLHKDPLYLLAESIRDLYSKRVAPICGKLNDEISLLSRLYMKGQMEVMTERKYYPDANLTLRLAYGKVAPYSPHDAVVYTWYTTLDGVMEKEDPNVDEFHVSPKLKELWKNKDYGQYADADGKLHVAFIATNHTTGGNSGSPVLDAYGNLIGINFDRCWEGTMSDEAFDPDICRNISVDVRYVLFVADKIGGAGYLVNEMKLVK